MAGSIEGVDYRIRPNKSIERKLIFEAFSLAHQKLSLHDYRYVGLGAISFVDFCIAHKQLRIRDMISIECEENAARAAFNAPFKCITVVPGDTSVVFASKAVDCAAKKAIFWLDYDGTCDASVVSDLRVVCTEAPAGSFLLVTVNAVRASYLIPTADGGDLGLEASLRSSLGSLVPDPLPEKCDTMNGFPPMLASLLFDHCIRSVSNASGMSLEFLPIFNFVYQDGKAPMITIGGAICDPPTKDVLLSSGIFAMPYVKGTEQFKICVPVLTPRERRALDKLLPSDELPTVEEVNNALSFPLSERCRRGYQDFYRFYPNFFEVVD